MMVEGQTSTKVVLLQKYCSPIRLQHLVCVISRLALPHAVATVHCLRNTQHILIGKNIHGQYIIGQNKSCTGLLPDSRFPWGQATPN